MTQTAKIFASGRSQAVRLLAAFRFDSDEVFIRGDEATGDVILSRKPADWEGVIAALKQTPVPADFLDEQERRQVPHERDPFDG